MSVFPSKNLLVRDLFPAPFCPQGPSQIIFEDFFITQSSKNKNVKKQEITETIGLKNVEVLKRFYSKARE